MSKIKFGKIMKTKSNLYILTIILMIVGIIMLLWVNHEIRNYVIPNTGLTIKEAMKAARQPVLPQIWIGLILFVVSYALTFRKLLT
jgi:c-di-AMP phosphodiesterase-like protein